MKQLNRVECLSNPCFSVREANGGVGGGSGDAAAAFIHFFSPMPDPSQSPNLVV